MPSKSVKIYDHGPQGIYAKIPYELKDKHGAFGFYRKKQNLWAFPYSEYAAYRLCRELYPYIEHCDPGIERMAGSYSRAHQAKEIDNLPDPSVPALRTKPWGHQRKAHFFASELHGAALLMGMGTGKSLTAISILKTRARNKNLIVCPKSVLDVWPDEFHKHLAEDWMIVAPLKRRIKERAMEAKKWMDVAEAKGQPYALLINYEAFWRSDFADLLQQTWWDNVIFDEMHKLKDPKSKASQFASKLVNNSTYRLGLTGTFLAHSPLDAFGQYRALDPSIFGGSFYRYKLHFALWGGFDNRQVVQYVNQDELNRKIESIGIQIDSEVLDLPEEIHSFRKCYLSNETRKVYESMSRELYAEVENGEITIANAMVKVLRLQQLTSGHIKTDSGELMRYGNEKRELLRELLEEIPAGERVVVFARFTPDIENIKAVASDMGRTVAELSGQRNEVASFQQGEADILAAQVQAGSLGIDLSMACYCIIYSIGHSLGEYQQLCRRVNRPGQTRTVRYYHLLAKDSVDEKVYNALQAKEEVVNYILHGIRQERQIEEAQCLVKRA